MPSSTPTMQPPEAIARKARSEAILRAEGIAINKTLPTIEAENSVKLRDVLEIACRALSLLTVALKGEGLEQPLIERIIGKFSLVDHFTVKETDFIKQTSPSQFDRIQFTWRYEAAWPLLWALGFIEQLNKPDGVCDVRQAIELMQSHTKIQFLAKAQLRPLPDILDQTDLIYRYHWATTDARINNREAPPGTDPGVISERHYALNWLTGYMDQEWDDIRTHT